MPISNPISVPETLGILDFHLGLFPNDYDGFIQRHNGKWLVLTDDVKRTIGNSTSGADVNYDWLEGIYFIFGFLYSSQVSWQNSSGTSVPSLGFVDSNWAANYRMVIPDFRGRGLIGAGQGASLTNRIKGSLMGSETHVLTTAQLPAHTHNVTTQQRAIYTTGATGGNALTSVASSNATFQSTSVGSGEAHNNMQPSRAENLIVSCGVL